MAPIAKAGGLADVVTGLSKELLKKGHLVEVILPKYDCLDLSAIQDLHIVLDNLLSYYKGKWIKNRVFQGTVEGLSVLFIDSTDEWKFFQRGSFYNAPDNIERFTYFSRVVLEFLLKSGRNPDILHLHDWHTGLIPVLYHEMYKALGLKIKKNILTIHNLYHQGHTESWLIDAVGLNSAHLHHPDRLQDEKNPHLLNILKGAIVYSNACTTVSPTYAEEIKTPDGGAGLDRLLRFYSHKIFGILNGIDTSYWNPETDPLIPFHYSPSAKATFFKNKALCKAALKKRLNLAETNKPLIGLVSRLVPQKGIDLIHHAILRTIEKGGQFVLMGTASDPGIAERFEKLKKQLSKGHEAHLALHHNEGLAHQIFAGSDAFLIPSIFEPCGLTQQIALKYGTIPIARRTGGLIDTVFDIETSHKPPKERNGFTFDHADKTGVNWGVDRMLKTIQNEPFWQELMLRAASEELSWARPAGLYLDLYNH